jgi:hypothetical protein
MPGVIATDGNLVVVDFGRPASILNTKKQEAARLNRSTRWLELACRDRGCPSQMRNGKRMFVPSEVDDWLAGQQRGAANG